MICRRPNMAADVSVAKYSRADKPANRHKETTGFLTTGLRREGANAFLEEDVPVKDTPCTPSSSSKIM